MSPTKIFLRRFRRDRSGVSAVEFALILPAMLTLYLGTYEVTQGLALDRLVKLNASSITNLVAQYTTISATNDWPDILAASSQILAPYPTSAAKTLTTVSLVTIDGSGNAIVAWTLPTGSGRAIGSAVAVPTALDKPNTTLVLGETSTPYTSPIQFLPIGTWNLHGMSYMAPRASITINQTS
jgi:Flp pilus assembly protein TadG